MAAPEVDGCLPRQLVDVSDCCVAITQDSDTVARGNCVTVCNAPSVSLSSDPALLPPCVATKRHKNLT